jgi:predicted helicase
MTSGFRQALEIIRQRSNNPTELGAAFEKMAKVYLEHDPLQTQYYEKVWNFADWAATQQGYQRKDIGIDLVAQIKGTKDFCAIQCKCYDINSQITKADIDSFIAAATGPQFKSLLLVDTSISGFAPNAQQVLDHLGDKYRRIQTAELEASPIDWLTLVNKEELRLRPRKTPLPHQLEALADTEAAFKTHDRGKIIMACGTGKTYTSQIIAEQMVAKGQSVLYMVPSLSLMSQSVRDWKNDAQAAFTAFAVCSDQTVGSRKDDDEIILSVHDLAFPATTKAEELAKQVQSAPQDQITVVFATYHSIDVISEAQKQFGMTPFELIICDEAHRTTGATLVGDDESNFVKIHNNANVQGKRRLYMTATPRIYAERAKAIAGDQNISLASMDDESTYGPVFFHRGFGWAVENDLLTDYKVVVLAVDEAMVSDRVQNLLAEGSELKLDDASKIVGCYKALAKIGFRKEGQVEIDSNPNMQRVLAFCQNIKLSKLLAKEFVKVVTEYQSKETDPNVNLAVDVRHVDGSYNADKRSEQLNWLKDSTSENCCRILSNVRCLSEGVDVPTLDAVIFMHPRKSQIDVVQSVGRVMRKAADKNIGYVVIPITIAPGVTAEKALNDNKKYQVVWQILNALRSHDERFDSTINKIKIGEDVSNKLEIFSVGGDKELAATTKVIDDLPNKFKKAESEENPAVRVNDVNTDDVKEQIEEQVPINFTEITLAIKAQIVKKCGTRDYWENWAKNISEIAQTYITRIKTIVFNSNTKERRLFEEFVAELKDDLNPAVTEEQAVEMLAQHLVTKPVFEALFKDHKFTESNPVSKAMQYILEALEVHNLEKEREPLEKFYESVRKSAADIVTKTGRQTLILHLYDKFFSHAFKSLTEKLGIVYTPVEVVDFIIKSVEDVLQQDLGRGLADENVHILDPFVGTGTFISRLLESGLINAKDLSRKYRSEIHANEIVLLAYYIGSINIESVYQDLTANKQYAPFNGIVLTDTFQLYEEGKDMIANLLPDNSKRRNRQKRSTVKVIIGNPPYSAGQRNANDNAANLNYPNLDNSIEATYVRNSSAKLKTALYDSYIRAFRLASDRIDDEGVIGFVTGAGWIDGNAMDGLRRCLTQEFDKIYVFNLRGNARTSGEERRKENGNVFGDGSRTAIAITILVRRSSKVKTRSAEIYYHEIGDYLSRDEKLALIKQYGSIAGVTRQNKWKMIKPDASNDWINQGESGYASFLALGDKLGAEHRAVFHTFSAGIKSNRDAWNFNYSAKKLTSNVIASIEFYNSEVIRLSNQQNRTDLDSLYKLIQINQQKISWDSTLIARLSKNKEIKFDPDSVRKCLYRPYTVTFGYIDRCFNNSVYLIPSLFPNPTSKNVIIVISSLGAQHFSCLATDLVPSHDLISKGQAFPRFYYMDAPENAYSKSELLELNAINPNALKYVNLQYQTNSIDGDMLFSYIYGVMHSEEFREKYKNSLAKEKTRLPLVKNFTIFKQFAAEGRKLLDIHLQFESAQKYPVVIPNQRLPIQEPGKIKNYYKVIKMKFAGVRGREDKSTIIYNHNITIAKVPLDAYEYKLNGKSAIEWVMERQSVKTDKDSGIINDANEYAAETVDNPAYPLELLQRVITVSVDTMRIVKRLPLLDL